MMAISLEHMFLEDMSLCRIKQASYMKINNHHMMDATNYYLCVSD